MRKMWLGVPRENPEDIYIEDSERAVEYAVMSGMGVAFYPLTLDENDVPSIDPVPVAEL